MDNNADRWLSDGNCELCRRKKYCNKPCKASQKFMMRQAISLGAQFAAKMLSDMQEKHEKKDEEDKTE